MLAYAWPGNIRELEHLIGRSALRWLAAQQTRPSILTLDAAALDLHAPAPATPDAVAPPPLAEPAQAEASGFLRDALASYERQLVSAALQRHGGNLAATARELGVDRANLNRLAKRLACGDLGIQ